MVKWPEKAVSDSSRELAQLSFLVQVERAACVTFPLCAVKVTHWTGAASENLSSGAVLRSRGNKCLTAMQAAARHEGVDAPVKGASVFTVQIRSENHPAVQHQDVAYRQSLQRSV